MERQCCLLAFKWLVYGTDLGLCMQLLDLLEHKSIFTAGYKAILHIHSLVEECEITRLISSLDMKTKPPTPKKVNPHLLKLFRRPV
jgi:translation elongation factor EF-1alpha